LLPARSFDAPMNILDVSKAQHLLQWQPEIALQDGMARLLQHMKCLL
jgi:UDP-glucose 4-epimerase